MTLHSRNRFLAVISLLLLTIFGETACYSQDVPKFKFDVRKRSKGGAILECLGWEPKMFFEQPDMIAACQAVQDKSMEGLKQMQANGFDWNAQGKGGTTILFWALLSEDFPIYEQLLIWGADPNIKITIADNVRLGAFKEYVGNGDTVFAITSRLIYRQQWFETTLTHGGDPHFVENRFGWSLIQELLHSQGQLTDDGLRPLQMLIDAGADLNHLDKDGWPAVIAAFVGNQPQATVLLIEQGASVDCYDKNDWQLIHHMAGIDILRVERHAADPKAREDWNESHYKKAWDQTVKLLAERGHSLVDAKIDYHRRFETVDGIPYMKWRRMMRQDKDPCVSKSKKSATSPAGEVKTAPEPKLISPPKIQQAN
ncbi:MAG: ankyrin repeat domain-containing protein [Planctomycetia bacterium]